MNPKDTPEHKALYTNQTDLQRHVREHLKPIADRLRDLEILIPDQHEEILGKKTREEGAQQLVSIVMQTIETDPESYYYLFVDVLKRDGNAGLKTFVEDKLEASRRRFYQDELQQTGDANPASYDVFISYGREDGTASFAENLYGHLQEQGLSVFMDTKSIAPGDPWRNTISRAIHSAKVFIALLTKKYVKSRYCKSELYVAEAEGKSVFPVVYKDGWESGTLGQSVKMVVEKNNYAWFQPSRRDYGKQLSSLTSRIMRRFNKSPKPHPSSSCKKTSVYVTAMLVLPLVLAGLGYWYFSAAGPVVCVALPSLDNGSISYSPDETGPDYDVGTIATHTCQDGFTLRGNSKLTCENLSRWSSNPPFCQGSVDESSNVQHSVGNGITDPIHSIPIVAAKVSSDLIHMIHGLYVMFKPKENTPGTPQQNTDNPNHSNNDHIDTVKNTIKSHEITSLTDMVSATSDIGNWEGLCVNLRVNSGVMNELRYSHEAVDIKKIRCLETYFNTGEAIWEDLLRAVSAYPINNQKVAKEIARKYGIDLNRDGV